MNVDSKMTFKTFYYGLLHNKHFTVVSKPTYKETIFYSKKYSFEYFLKEFLLPKNKSIMFDYNYVGNYNEDGDDAKKQYIRLTIVSEKGYVVKIDFPKELSGQKDTKNNSSQITKNYPIEFKSVRDFCAFIKNDKEGLFTETHEFRECLYMFNKSFEDFLRMFKFSRTLDLSDFLFEKNRILIRFEYYSFLIIGFKNSFIKQLMLDKMNNLIHHEESIKTESENDRIEICTLNQLEKALSKDKNFKCSTEKHGNIYLESFENFVSRYKIYEELKVEFDCSRQYPTIVIWDEDCGRIIEFINEKRSFSNDDLNRLKSSSIQTETKDNRIEFTSIDQMKNILDKDSSYRSATVFNNQDGHTIMIGNIYIGMIEDFVKKYKFSNTLTLSIEYGNNYEINLHIMSKVDGTVIGFPHNLYPEKDLSTEIFR